MIRATINDIARAAGVSKATVDRVLNGRAGVSASNRHRVLRATQDLQYLPKDGQSFLPARPAQLEFFVQRRGGAFLTDVAKRLEVFAHELPLVSTAVIHDLPDLFPETLVAALEHVQPGTQGIGIVAVDHPLTRLAVRDLVESGVRVVTFGSDLLSTSRSAFIGLDERVAGRTAGLVMGRFCDGKGGTLGMSLGQRAFYGQRERELGFVSVIDQEFPGLRCLPAVDIRNDEQAEKMMRTLLAEHSDLRGIYCMGGGQAGLARVLASLPRGSRPLVIMHDLSDVTRRYLSEGLIDLVIDQNARLVAEQTVIQLLSSIASTSKFLPEHFIEPRLIFRENIPV